MHLHTLGTDLAFCMPENEQDSTLLSVTPDARALSAWELIRQGGFKDGGGSRRGPINSDLGLFS
jgi:hypothetical protein